MKIKTAIILSCLIGVAFLSIGYEYSRAEPEQSTSEKIGVVDVRAIFRDCKRNINYREQVLADYKKSMAELEKLAKEIEADEAGLKTLKQGSPDYMNQYKQLLEKQANLNAQREYNKQQRVLNEQQNTEELYKDILQIARELALQNNLDLVLEKNEPEFPMASTEELVAILNTHKVIYSSGCLDLTKEVIARLDAK